MPGTLPRGETYSRPGTLPRGEAFGQAGDAAARLA